MNGKRKFIIVTALVVMLLAIGGVGAYYWYQSFYYVTTEDAKVTADIVRVSPQITGKLIEFNVEEGQKVVSGQLLGRQEMINLPDSGMELAALKAPVSGIVIKTAGNVGEVVAPGQPLAMLVEPGKVYITANIDETKLGKVQPGQKVDVTLDLYGSRKFTGTVRYVGQAAVAVFSMLPASSGGNFTKVIQKVPVKIYLDDTDGFKLLPGVNAMVRIHVK